MGMLMHHTWLNQQKENVKPKVEPKPAVEEVKKEKSAEEPPVKRAGGRRKATKE